ncbi:24904_t:CDS:2, partial [Dentiscutata erythropus]
KITTPNEYSSMKENTEENTEEIDAKALAYAQKHEGKCLAKVSSNTYLWAYKKKHQWEASYKNMKQNYQWYNICPNVPERTCRYIFEDLLHKKFPLRKPKFLKGLHLDRYNEELGLAFEYSGNQHYQIMPFFHPQGQMNLDAQICHNWKKRVLCYKEGVILITILYCVVDLETFIKSALYAFGYLSISI